MLQAPETAALQLVLAGQAASRGTSAPRGSPGTALLQLMSSTAGEKCDRLLVPAAAGVDTPGVLALTTSSYRGE